MAKALFELNPDLDRTALAERFSLARRLQVEDILTDETARELRQIMVSGTEWGVALQAGATAPPRSWRGRELRDPAVGREVVELVKETDKAAAQGDYAYRSHRYSLVEGLQKEWQPGGPYELLLEYLNAPDFLGFMREITGIPELVKADGHASCFGPNHFLGRHNDSHVAEGWKVAYVLNLTIDDWHPDWGGYLVFYDETGNIETGFMPRFNTLNLFLVPQDHAVTYVPPFAPRGRYAISGWLRDR
ncbi:2OG-Fe(II) oxygenase [Aurantiacibacter poecillastricola]|uniref:2OG-Fe(II) oxygenase n=1 Tax=Aurantiacibacter poecillastricola TaxID=3064385 RepID=UPI00273EF9FE|nr:2OG-Fe(II) oxygenase family protein [Aurantiacibacter sp. 219JJ12-13]MDP5261811.1 2OG-Fe(II) oxygenase family protein [Aurantiacibacter sp. 219JJ12-13]